MTDFWMTEAEGRRFDLPIVRGMSEAAELTIGDMGGIGDDRADEFSLSLPLRKDGGTDAEGPEASEESSSAKSDFFLRRSSAADPSGIPGLEETSDRSSSSRALGRVFFFRTLLTLAGLS